MRLPVLYNTFYRPSSFQVSLPSHSKFSPSLWSTSTVTGVDALPMIVTLPFITSAILISSWCLPGSGRTKSSLKQFELSKGVAAMARPLLISAAENRSRLFVLFSAWDELNVKHPFAVMPAWTKNKEPFRGWSHHMQPRGHAVKGKIQEEDTHFHWRRAKCLLPGQCYAAVADVLAAASHYQ